MKEAIRALPLFDGLDQETVGFMAERMQEVSVPIGGHIVKAGDFAYRFFLILEGSAAVSRDGVPVATLKPGEVFGEMALVEDVRRNADVVAVSAMRLLTLMSWDFRDALAQLPEFRRRNQDLMAKRT
jgi:CRP-like cAMP-binding protein